MPLEEYNIKTLRLFLNNDEAVWLYKCCKKENAVDTFEDAHRTYYKDGMKIISEVLAELGYIVSITISKRNLEAVNAEHDFE